MNANPKKTSPVWWALVGLVALLPLGGCTPIGVAVGAGATAGTAALQERGFQQSVKDSVIEAAISKDLFDRDLNVFANLNVEVVEGRVFADGFRAGTGRPPGRRQILLGTGRCGRCD